MQNINFEMPFIARYVGPFEFYVYQRPLNGDETQERRVSPMFSSKKTAQREAAQRNAMWRARERARLANSTHQSREKS